MKHYSRREELAGQRAEKQRLAPFMRALKAIHSAATPEVMNVEDLEKQRKNQELLGRLVAPMGGMSWETFTLDGMDCAWIRPQRGYDHRKAILYCHGGPPEGHPLLPRRRLHQRHPGLLPHPGVQAGHGHRIAGYEL